MTEVLPRQTYSHEAEDLIIQRLFQCVLGAKPKFRGFYVDIGAFHPIRFSNTYLLYQEGWRGINVEPNADVAESFRENRPEDTNLTLAISDSSRVLTYHHFDDPQVNGMYSEHDISMMVAHGYRQLGSTQIECIGINEFLHQYVHRPIDLLAIDIENHEHIVLNAWDWASYRPRLICVEIHSNTMSSALESPVGRILASQEYVLMSRVFQSSFFVDGRAAVFPY
jgi:FkbM family methyltransferase